MELDRRHLALSGAALLAAPSTGWAQAAKPLRFMLSPRVELAQAQGVVKMMAGRNYYPMRVDAWDEGGATFLSVIWANGWVYAAELVLDLQPDEAAFLAKDMAKPGGVICRSVFGYGSPLRYGMALGKNPSDIIGQKVSVGLTEAAFKAQIGKDGQGGPEWLDISGPEDDLRFSAIWFSLRNELRLDLTEAQVAAQCAAKTAAKRIPGRTCVYRRSGQQRFATVWAYQTWDMGVLSRAGVKEADVGRPPAPPAGKQWLLLDIASYQAADGSRAFVEQWRADDA